MSVLGDKEIADWKAELSKLDKKAKKLLRSTLAEGMYFRRERQWKVFTWASGIFTVLIAGFLIRGGNTNLRNFPFQVILSITATGLAILADHRIRHDSVQARLRAELIAEIDRELTIWIGDIERKYRPKKLIIGNRGILWLLYFVLIALIWATIIYPSSGNI